MVDVPNLGGGGVNEATFAPKFSIAVAGTVVDDNIKPFVRYVDYESTDGMADVFHLRCVNPESIVSNAKIFQPGNEISLFGGYKEPLVHIGRTIIQKAIPFFPESGEPALSVIGYTKDSSFADNAPEKSKQRRFADYKYSDAVREIATRYGMEIDINTTPGKPGDFIQRVGVSDYEFVQGLANMTGYTFWVDGDENGVWTLHFRDPDTLVEQDKEYTFKYNDGDNSSLLSFRPELLIKGSKTKIKVVVKDRKNGKVIKVEVSEENNAAPDIEVLGDPDSEVDGEFTSGSDIKLFFGNFSFDVISGKRFKDEEEARFWAEQWFRKTRENFVMASGSCIGTETLMARQKHKIENTSKPYDGEYYFSKIKHIFGENGYKCNFNCRRLVP